MIFRGLAGQRELLRSSALLFAGNSTARLLGFLFSVAAARILLPSDFGRFAFGLTIASIAAILVANAPRGLSRFLAGHDDDRRQQNGYFSNWLIVVGFTLTLSLLLLEPVSLLAGLSGWIVFAVGANLLGVAVLETYREAQRGLRRFVVMVVFYVAANLIQLLAILLAGRLGLRSPALFLTIYGLSSLAALALMQQARPIALRFLPDTVAWHRIWSIVRFVRPLVFQTVFYAIWSGTDIVLVGRILGPTATGHYAAAKTLVTILVLAPMAIAIVTGPEVARLSRLGQHGLRQYVTVALALTGAVSLPVAAGLVWFKSPIILLVFGSKYPLAARPLTVLAVGMTLYAFSLVLESLWVGLGQPRIAAIGSGLAMVCTVSLGLMLIPRMAEAGAAIAYTVGSAAQLAVLGSFTAWVMYSGFTLRAQGFADRGILDLYGQQEHPQASVFNSKAAASIGDHHLSSTDLPFASILLPAWNEAAVLEPTLRRLASLDYQGGFETVVVAGGNDGTLEKALRLQSSVKSLRVIEQLPRNKNAALLRGYEHINPATEVIGILDADTLVTSNWLTEMCECLRRGDYAAVQALYLPANPSWLSHYYMFLQFKYETSNKPTLVGRGSVLVRRDVIEKLNPLRAFDPNINIGADYHLRRVLQDAGERLGYCRQAKVESWLPASFSTFVGRESMWVRGWARQSRHTVRFLVHYLIDGVRIGSLVLALLAIIAQRPVVAAVVVIPAAFYLLKLCFDLLRIAVKGHPELLIATPQVIALNLVQLFIRFIAMNRVLAFDNPREAFRQGERPTSV